jgi:hypothetical protein
VHIGLAESLSASQWALAVVAVIGTTASVIGVVLAIAWSPRRSNERPVTGRIIPSIRFWRPSSYTLALGKLKQFIDRWKDGTFNSRNERGFVTEYDLVRWIIQLALTCAANMVPQSLGKANLFRVSQIERDAAGRVTRVKVYSSEFDGVFSPGQLIDVLDSQLLRDMSLDPQHLKPSDYPAALQCVLSGAPTIQSLRKRASDFDIPERSLGVTHVLGVPLIRDFSGVTPDSPVSITVDLRYFWLVGRLVDRTNLHRRIVLRRALQLASMLADVTALRDPRFLPPSDADELGRPVS